MTCTPRRRKRKGIGRIRSETSALLSVLEGLKTANIVNPDNVAAAIRSLSRGSTPGVDDLGLEFFLEHIDAMAPKLSGLFAKVLERGKMTPTMCSAVLSPLYKNKGSKEDRAMYISKTMVLLLGRERSFDLQAGTKAAQALRHRGLARTYDITPGMDDRLPDKWHGIVLGSSAPCLQGGGANLTTLTHLGVGV